MRSRLYTFCFAALAVIFFTACEKTKTPVFRLGFIVWPGYEAPYLASRMGYYDGLDIKLVQYPSSTDASTDMRNGAIEAVALTLDETLLLADEGVPVKIVAVLDYSNGADVIISKPEIQSMAELKGKKVGVEATALGAYVLSRSLELSGLKLEDVRIVNTTVNEHEELFSNGSLDAVVTFEPVRSNLLKKGGRLLFDSKRIPGEIVDVLVVRKDVYANNIPLIAKILNGHFKAVELLRSGDAKAIASAAEREGITPAQFSESLDGITLPTYPENLKLLTPPAAKFEENVKRTSGMMLSNHLLKKPPVYSELIGREPLELAAK